MADETNTNNQPKVERKKVVIDKGLFIMLVVGIIVLLIFTLGAERYSEYKEDKRIELNQTITESYNSGAAYGYLFGITQVMSNSQNCNIVPLSYNDITINMIDINCER